MRHNTILGGSNSKAISPSLIATLAAGSIALSLTVTISLSNFESTANAHVSVSSDTLESPTNLVIQNSRVGETDVSWSPSADTYATGYRIFRSENKYGPWTEIGLVQGQGSNKFVDNTSGSKSFNYRVESVYQNWVSTGDAYEAPPAAGLNFRDSFLTEGNIDGRPTEDGLSTWQVWNGSVKVEYSYDYPGWGYGAKGSGYGEAPAIAVVRTPVKDAIVWMADIDGSEGAILRGKDPKNYIYVGGAMNSGKESALLEVVAVRDGKREILASTSVGWMDRDMRYVIQGTKLQVYMNATKPTDTGQLILETTVDYLANDPNATYFGMGFVNENIARGFHFTAIQ